MCSSADLESDCFADFVDAVGDAKATCTWGVVVRSIGDTLARVYPAWWEIESVAVASSLGNGSTCSIDVRATDGAFLDGRADFECVRS